MREENHTVDEFGAQVVLEWPGGVLVGASDGMVALRESEQVTGLRPEYHENHYAAFVRDPDGHDIGGGLPPAAVTRTRPHKPRPGLCHREVAVRDRVR